MSEVDRLSNSGLFPALPLSDRQQSKDRSAGKPPDSRTDKPDPQRADADPNAPRLPKSLIDEYA